MPHILDGKGHLRATHGKALLSTGSMDCLGQYQPHIASVPPLAIAQSLEPGSCLFPKHQQGWERLHSWGSELSVWLNKGF